VENLPVFASIIEIKKGMRGNNKTKEKIFGDYQHQLPCDEKYSL